MPILGRTPSECFDTYTEHLGPLVAATVTDRYPLVPFAEEDLLQVSFRQGPPVAVPLDTDYGRLFFYLGQLHQAVLEDGQYRLTTLQYWYRIQHEQALNAKAVIRWEYDAATDRAKQARHHAQMATELALGDRPLDLDKAHLPTGWVTLEEVIRFLIYDLGLKPPCGDEWPEKVVASEDRFYQEFTGKRYKHDEAG